MIKKTLIFFLYFSVICVNSQNVTVDSQSYTPQQLIEDILIDSNCISNIQVTNTIGGNFGGSDQSYGFFDATGTTFPFQSGIVLSTGRLVNVPGPNTSLSDDNAPNWSGDAELETALNESNTINATILEFDFVSPANQISFRYLFASEEYQEGNSNTCQYSDLFGFLIKPASAPATDYENIALIPGTQTPVKVTTVHSGIPGSCDPINEAYFGSWNDSSYQPINFNGQTSILTATANTVPNITYHVKLVIADEQNFRYDSAVFLEAGSFKLTTDLGPNLLEATDNALCNNQTTTLNATQTGAINYKWFRNNVELPTETNAILTVGNAGTYNVEVTLANGCISYGEVVVEQFPPLVTSNTSLTNCNTGQNGFSTFNLINADQNITAGNPNLSVLGFYTSQQNAIQQQNEISTPESFQNTSLNQIVYALIINAQTSCTAISQITLQISNNNLPSFNLNACDTDEIDGFTIFDLNEITTQIQALVPVNATVNYYLNEADAFANTNSLTLNFENTVIETQTIYAKVVSNGADCYAITTVNLTVLDSPEIEEDDTKNYCLNNFPETITLQAGVLNDVFHSYSYQWLLNGTDTGITTPFINANQIGTYTAIVSVPNGCSNSRNIIVTPSSAPTIDNIEVTELTANNTATVTVSGEGDYEYAINNAFGYYQNQNTFSNLLPGFYTIYVRDKNGCGNAEIEFSILGFPKYFTPNGDNINEVWKPIGSSRNFNSNLELLIFNRYGKLLSKTTALKGWDGTINGFNLPTNDYWFIINHPNGKQYKGHFSLVR